MDPYRILLLLLFFFLRFHEGLATAVEGGQFAKGSIEVAGIELRKHTKFTKICTAAPLNSGDSTATFFSPSSLPSGFTAAGHLTTTSPQKPPLSSLRCLPNHLLEPCHSDALTLTWSPKSDLPVTVRLSLCLKKNVIALAAMPNATQITTLIQTFSPIFSFHPKEPYLSSSVPWFFNNGALLYTNSSSNGPIRIEPAGKNLPQGGTNDGAYWLDLPTDANNIKSGNLSSAETYIHIKPTPPISFSGSSTLSMARHRARLGFIEIALGRIGEHVGDWEHVTQRFSNFDGEMKQMYFSEHSSGKWVDPKDLEYTPDGGRRPAAYATLHGHAFYPKAGMVLLGEMEKGIGVMDETAEGGAVMDAAAKSAVVSSEHLGVEEPAWLQYMREWGPKVRYEVDKELGKMMRFLPGKMKRGLRNLMSRLPEEMLGEEGPTGPKGKASWNGEES